MPNSLIYFAPRPAAGQQLPTNFAQLLVDFISGPIVVPAYVTVLSVTLTTILPASFFWFDFSSTWRSLGVGVGNNAVNFRFRLDGGLLVGGVTDNKATGQIGSVSRVDRTAVVAGLHTLDVEVSKFGNPANSVVIDVASLPDLNNCAVSVREEL